MPLRTAEQYRASLQDSRRVFFRGQRVDDITSHPIMSEAVSHASIDFDMAEQAEYRSLAVIGDGPTAYSRYYHLPATSDDLLKRSALIEAATREGRTLVVLIKEIGSDALFGLHLATQAMDDALGTSYLPRVQQFHAFCKEHDLALAVAQTDVKGDRSRAPSEQSHPDYYVRIVERRPDGIVVSGAKVHTSVSVNANELIVLPTRAMGERDADYAVAFAVSAATPGVTLIASPHGTGPRDPFERPLSSGRKMFETLTVFDNVFVPNERVFLAGEWQFAGPVAVDFVEFHRFTAISYKLPLVDLLVGSAFLLAQYNGLTRVSHIRDKLARLVAYAEILRALTHAAAERCQMKAPGLAVPDPMLVNLAKLHFAGGYHQAVSWAQDIAGGLLVTGPASEDLESPETRGYIERYFGAGEVNAETRLRAMNVLADLTASDFGGYQEVLAVHAEGSIEAEKLTALRNYNAQETMAYAKRMAGIQE
jgi:aromatic ring hydroxylase